MILEIISAAVPIVTNVIGKIAGVREKRIESEMTLSENALKALEVKARINDSNNNFEIERMKTIAQTFKTGNALVDGLQGGVRVAFGLMAVLAMGQALGAGIFGWDGILSRDDLATMARSVLFYYLSAYSCQKVF